MKLSELANVVSPGDKTNLSGGNMPNAYRDDASKADKNPRKKKKDVYGVNYAVGGTAMAVDTGGDMGGSDGGTSGGSSGSGGSGGSGGGSGGGGGGS